MAFSFLDSDRIEELELKVVNYNTLISEDELTSAVSAASLLDGFILTKQDGGGDKPLYTFQKETVFKDVEENGVRLLAELFPHTVWNKKTLQKLTRDCEGKGLENNACVLGVEVHPTELEDSSYYQAIPVITLFMGTE